MSLYEGMFLMDNRQANRDWEDCLERLKGIITKHGGEILRCTKWGERRLAYEVKGRRRGTYVLMYFRAAGNAIGGIHRECELSELMLRALMLKVAVLPPAEEAVAGERADAAKRAEKPVAAAAAEAKTEAKTEAKDEAKTEAKAEAKDETEGGATDKGPVPAEEAAVAAPDAVASAAAAGEEEAPAEEKVPAEDDR